MNAFQRQKQPLFIYGREEMIILVILCLMVAFFTFTLGVHLGKKIGAKTFNGSINASLVKTLSELRIPNGQELTEQARAAQQALEETLGQDLEEEVKQTQIKIDSPRQVDLPKKTVSSNAGATTIRMFASENGDTDKTEALSKYTLQIGSYPSLEEAKRQVSTLSADNLKAFLHEAEIEGKGTWYRVYVGGYPTRSAAQQAGTVYRTEHKISSFIVAKRPDR